MHANFGFGLIAMVAYNFLRIIARLDEPDKPHYAKKLREKYIWIPAKVVKHARQMFLRIPRRFREEVQAMTSGWAGILPLMSRSTQLLDWGIWEKHYGRPLEDWEKTEIEMNLLALFKVLGTAELENITKDFKRKEADLKQFLSMIHI